MNEGSMMRRHMWTEMWTEEGGYQIGEYQCSGKARRCGVEKLMEKQKSED